MRILITGSTGFIGRTIAGQAAECGIPVLALVRSEPRVRLSKVEYLVAGDLESPEVLRGAKAFGPTACLHCAWQGVDGGSRNLPAQISVNIPFTLGCVSLAAKAGCSHWIGAGSQAEYGVSNRKIDELAPTLPTTVYGQSKLAACLSTQKFCEAVGMNWSWLRVFSVYGPGDHPHWFIPYIIGELRAGRSPKLTKCEQVWDYLFIRDAAEAFIELARKQAGGIYNLGSGRTVSLRQVVEIISARLDSKTLPEFGAVPYRDDQVMHLEADIRRLTAATGWVPKTSIEIGLAETINVSNASP